MNEHYTVDKNIYATNSGHHCYWDLNYSEEKFISDQTTRCQSTKSGNYMNENNISQYYDHKYADNS